MLNEKKIPHNVSDRLYPLHRAVSLDTKSIISIFEHYRNVCVWERERESVEMFSWALGETVYLHPPLEKSVRLPYQ